LAPPPKHRLENLTAAAGKCHSGRRHAAESSDHRQNADGHPCSRTLAAKESFDKMYAVMPRAKSTKSSNNHDGSFGGDYVRLIDFDNPEANDWLAVNQFTVIEREHNRQHDIVG
jgi:type I site-specific restriction-modification system R (restriction) subunit